MPQGWPKFALSVFMKNENAVFSAVPAPAVFTTVLHGVKVSVSCETRYPFGDGAVYTVKTDAPVSFSLDIRIPGYAVSAQVDGQDARPGSVFSLARTWSGTETVTVSFAFRAVLENAGYLDLCVVNRGPLLFSLPIGVQKIMAEYTRNGVERKFPYCDYLLYPTTDWGFGFASDEFVYHPCEDDARLSSAPAFDQSASPVTLEAVLAPIDWGKKEDFAWVCADYPRDKTPTGDARRMTLIPYGCTDLRMTAMPRL